MVTEGCGTSLSKQGNRILPTWCDNPSRAREEATCFAGCAAGSRPSGRGSDEHAIALVI